MKKVAMMTTDGSAPATASPVRLFERLFAKRHQSGGEDHYFVSFEGKGCWWSDPAAIPLGAGRGFNIHAVGESQFQTEIASIVGGHCEEGHDCQVPAEVVLAETERDPDAVGVRINNLLVGYLPFEAAEQVRPLLVTLTNKGKAITCNAKIVGGWDRENATGDISGSSLACRSRQRCTLRQAAS
jgi:hypothetical protein